MAGDALPKILREPLLHFALMGAVVFAIWGERVPEAEPEPGEDPAASQPSRVIVVEKATQDRLFEEFGKRKGRDPTDEERESLIDAYVDGELLYREGLELGLDRGDPVIRQRIIKKVQSISTDIEQIADPDEATLEAFLKEFPERYAGPARFDFEVLAVTESDTMTAQRVSELLQELRAGTLEAKAVDGRLASGKRFSAADINKTYGVEVGAAVIELPPGEWGMLPFQGGWTLVHQLARHEGEPPPLSKVRNRVLLDWKQSQRNVSLRARLDELRAKYTIQLET